MSRQLSNPELAAAVEAHLGPDALAYLIATVPNPLAWRAEVTRYLRQLADRVNRIDPLDVRYPHVAKRSQAVR